MKHKSKKPKIDFDTPPPTTSVKVTGKVRVSESIETTESTTVSEVYAESHATSQGDLNTQSYQEQTADQNSEQASDSGQDNAHETAQEGAQEQGDEQERVKIDFPFSFLVRDRVPKVFDVAETAATQWKNNAKFENLGVEHPVAEIALVKVLEKAKDVERKLEEKGIISAAKMGIQVAKFQAEEILKKIKK